MAVWKEVKKVKRLDREKVVKSGWSGKFDKKTDFPKKKKPYRDPGQVDFEDHEIEIREEQYTKENRAIEKSGRKNKKGGAEN